LRATGAVERRAGTRVTPLKPITLGRAWDLLDTSIPTIAAACADLQALTPAGAFRRIESLVSSVVLVASSPDPTGALQTLASTASLQPILTRKDRRVTIAHRNQPIDIVVASVEEYGSVLFGLTGSAPHVREIERRLDLSRRFSTEDELYASIDLPFIAPELRNAAGEIEAAEENRLPNLIVQGQIRGDFHMHTQYSDGRDTVEQMIAACHQLGYEYMAITDHSSGSSASRTLQREEIAKQRDLIEQLREHFPGMTILHGVEVDILSDGRLDFDDETLARFDIVLASLHERDGQVGRQLTRRSLAAIRHPLVNILCHPANQLVGHHEGYDLDFAALYGAAVETGTALEIDGAPGHMDLDSERARAAADSGVTVTIDSDCHRVEALGRQMGFGIGIARRAWIEPHQVLNTRPLSEVREFIAAKRRGRR
jgi:DNA polymerase (family 10)